MYKPARSQTAFKRLKESAVNLSLLLLLFGIFYSHQTSPSMSITNNKFLMNSMISILDSAEYYSILNTQHILDNSSLSNNSTNSTVDPLNGCYTILLNLGYFSRYGPNATVVYGVCPDTWLSVSFSIAFMVFYTILLILTCLGLYWKRNSRHIQSRGLVYMLLTLFASAFIVYTTSLRYSIGRREYPCLIYGIIYFVLPPSLILPAIFRCYRLVMLHLLNLKKMKMLIGGATLGVGKSTTNLQSIAHKITKKGNNGKPTNSGMNSSNTTTTTVVEAFTTESQNVNTSINESAPMSPVSNTSIDSSTTLTKQVDHNTSPRAFLKKKSASNFSLKDVDKSVKMVDFDVSEYGLEDDVKSYTCSDGYSVAREEFDKEMKRAKILNFFVSNHFIVLTYFIIFSLHFVLFLIMGGIEWDQKLKKGTTIFTNDGGLFTVERGCGITNATFILVGTETFFYIVVEIILLIMCIIADRDTWNMRKETFILVGLKLIAIIVFVACGFIPVFAKFLDFFIPYGNVLLFYSVSDVVISITLPIVYAWVSDKKHVDWNQDSGLEQCLANKKTFTKLLDFARRSYCPEPILCYQDVERLNRTKPKNRKKIALHIQKTYLRKGSPLELNHPKLDEIHNEAKELIESNADVLPFFRKIQLHCMNDMIDIFERVKKQDEEVKRVVEEWQALNINATNTTSVNNFQSPNI